MPQVPKSHLVSPAAVVFTCRAVEKYAKRFTRLEFVLKLAEGDSIQALLGCIRTSSDKPKTFSKVGILTKYPLHITLLNFTDEMGRRQIPSCSSIVATSLLLRFFLYGNWPKWKSYTTFKAQPAHYLLTAHTKMYWNQPHSTFRKRVWRPLMSN